MRACACVAADRFRAGLERALAEYRRDGSKHFSAHSTSKAIALVRAAPMEITSGEMAQQLRGIGKVTGARLRRLRRAGTHAGCRSWADWWTRRCLSGATSRQT